MRGVISFIALSLISCASPRPAGIFVDVSEVNYAVGEEVVTTRPELAHILLDHHANLVELRIVGKPSYQQIEQAVQAVRDAGGRLNIVGASE